MGQHRIGKPQEGFSGSQEVQPPREFRIQYGHNGTQVLMIFPNRVENLVLHEEQVDEMVKALHGAKAMLIEHKKRAGTSQKS